MGSNDVDGSIIEIVSFVNGLYEKHDSVGLLLCCFLGEFECIEGIHFVAWGFVLSF